MPPYTVLGRVFIIALLAGNALGCKSKPDLSLEESLLQSEIPDRPSYVDVDFYTVRGKTILQVENSLRASGPVDTVGHRRLAFTGWFISWRWPFLAPDRPDYARAEIVSPMLLVLPHWGDLEGAPKELQDKWKDFVVAILRHERNHLRLVVEGINDLQLYITTLHDIPEREAKELLKAKVLEIDRFNASYDRESRNGFLEGACWANCDEKLEEPNQAEPPKS